MLAPWIDEYNSESVGSNLKMLIILSKDTYVRGVEAKWRYIDQYEATIKPLIINLSRK